jgi:NTE family protein
MFWPRLESMLARSNPRSDRLSIYDTSPLRRTLEKLIDFERLNSGAIRVSVMTVDIETGEEAVFDTSSAPLRLEHLLASIGFIPDFPPVEIEGRLLSDGGLSANTPVEIVLSESADDLLCFVLDCFPRAGRRPQSLLEASERQSDLIFANQTQKAIDAFVRAAAAQPRRERTIDIVRLAYRASADEFGMKGFDFSRATLERRWQSGANDMAAALEILAPLERKAGIRVLNPAA